MILAWTRFEAIGFGGLFEIAVLAFAFYYIFRLFRGTRGAQVLVGFAVILAILIGLTQIFSLNVVNWILSRISVFLGVALVIIFQPEIRRALAELGRKPLFAATAESQTVVDSLLLAVLSMASSRTGALIAIEREIGTRAIQETGTRIDAPVVPALIETIFFPRAPLHDGGMIISANRIVAAGCVLPLSQNADLNKQLGMRHRAAIGLSEETDAVVIVVSEETGTISVCYRGRLSRGLDEDRLRRFLTTLLIRSPHQTAAWSRLKKHLQSKTKTGSTEPREAPGAP